MRQKAMSFRLAQPAVEEAKAQLWPIPLIDGLGRVLPAAHQDRLKEDIVAALDVYEAGL